MQMLITKISSKVFFFFRRIVAKNLLNRKIQTSPWSGQGNILHSKCLLEASWKKQRIGMIYSLQISSILTPTLEMMLINLSPVKLYRTNLWFFFLKKNNTKNLESGTRLMTSPKILPLSLLPFWDLDETASLLAASGDRINLQHF